MISILIFSCNRSHYLRRAIKYWALSPWPVIISDGSDESLNVDLPSHMTYLHRPGDTIQSRIIELSKKAATPYSVLAPDDDFHTFGGIEKSLSFLKKNLDYSMTQGLYTRYRVDLFHKKPLMHQDYQYASKYLFDDTKPEKRMIAAMTAPTMHYCYAVMRTELLRNVVNAMEGVRDMSRSTFELSFNMIALAYGKYKTLPIFYMAREYQLPSDDSYITFEDWVLLSSPEGFKKWQLNIAKIYSEITGLYLSESLIFIDKAITQFLDYQKPNILHSQPTKRYFQYLKDKIPTYFKYQLLKIKSNYSIIKMIFSDKVNFMEFRQDWKRIKQIILNS